MCVCVCVCVYIYIYIYICMERQKERELELEFSTYHWWQYLLLGLVISYNKKQMPKRDVYVKSGKNSTYLFSWLRFFVCLFVHLIGSIGIISLFLISGY